MIRRTKYPRRSDPRTTISVNMPLIVDPRWYHAGELGIAADASVSDLEGGYGGNVQHCAFFGVWSAAADVWSLGAMFFKILLGLNADVVVLDGVRVKVPVRHPRFTASSARADGELLDGSGAGGGGANGGANTWWLRSRELLHQMLTVDPGKRPGAQQALWHPAFNVSIAADIVEQGNLVTQGDKIQRLRDRCRQMRFADDDHMGNVPGAAPWMLIVRRDTLVEEALGQFYRKRRRTDLLRRVHVSFVGEAGVDAGGLRKDLFCTLFERVADPRHPLKLFECARGGTRCLPRSLASEGGGGDPRERAATQKRLPVETMSN